MADSLEIIICPACNKKMKKVFLPSKNINIDICIDGCGGIFLDNREFKRIDEQHEEIDEILALIENKTFAKVDESVARMCPSCCAVMVKNYSSINHEIQIDECYACGAKFLDNGELQKIRAEYLTENDRSADFTENLLRMLQQKTETK
ncbi:MAG: zf-TFIIB domain-containing protein [Candidatus Gastranaerophilales bacterium]|nr:zf-TFIIB domain-containing protein [Candidatus Gastranaerophilales bacterium]